MLWLRSIFVGRLGHFCSVGQRTCRRTTLTAGDKWTRLSGPLCFLTSSCPISPGTSRASPGRTPTAYCSPARAGARCGTPTSAAGCGSQRWPVLIWPRSTFTISVTLGMSSRLPQVQTFGSLMERMGHSTSRVAMVYLHSTNERQRKVADALDDMVRAELQDDRNRASARSASGANLARKAAKDKR